MATNKLFGEQLREERKKQHLTVEQVAALCDISRSYLTLIENGQRLPGKKIIPKLAAAFGIKTVVVVNWYLEHISHKIQKDLDITA